MSMTSMKPVYYKDLIDSKILDMKINYAILNGLKADDRLTQVWLNVFIRVRESYDD
jgi:hypothetical protein